MACLPWEKEGTKYQAREGMRWSYTSNKEPIVSFRPFPFYLSYAAAVIRDAGHETKVVDCLAEGISIKELLKIINDFQPKFFVAEMSTPSYNNDRKMFKLIKQSLPSITIITCGPHPTALPEEVLKENEGIINHVLVGEYDFTTNEIISGKKQEKIVRSPEGVNIDSIPWPARELFNMKKYNETFCDDYPNLHLLTSRGCPYSCNYCNIFLMSHGRTIRYRAPHDVVKEMKYCINTYGAKELWIEDDNINVNQHKLRELCTAMIQERINIPWKAMGHVSIKKETLDMMKLAGCNGMKFGVEVADDEILKRMGKGITTKMVIDTVDYCKKIGIKTHLTFCVGLPGETEQTMRKTVAFAQKYGDTYQMSIAAPFPGTPLFDEAKTNGWLNLDSWDDFNGLNKAIIDYPGLPSKKVFEIYYEGQKGTYYKTLKGSMFRKYLRMIYQERGIIGIIKLLKRTDIIRDAFFTRTKSYS